MGQHEIELPIICAGVPQHSYAFEAAALPTKTVIVYADRAEVKRHVHTQLAKGTNEIIIQNVSAVIERQSVRVDGNGVLIQEVQYQEMPIDTLTETERVRTLEDEKFDLESRKAELEDEIESLKTRAEVLDGVAGQIASGSNSPFSSPDMSPPMERPIERRHSTNQITCQIGQKPSPAACMNFLMDGDCLKNLATFLTYYGETVRSLKAEMRGKQRECERLHEQIEHLERRIDQLRCGYEYDSIKRNISIIVEVEANKEADLFVTYQVYCAGWKPTYDIRACSTLEEEKENSTVKLCYYGLVEQNTGDTWADCDLVLSTACPTVGGSPPALGTLSATLQRHSKNLRQRHGSARRKPIMSAASEEDMGFGSFDYNELVDAAAMQRLTLAHMSSDSNSCSSTPLETQSSACFPIARPVTIPSNGIEHKVLVAQVELGCLFRHEAVPCKSTSAYLSAMVTNSSGFPLLPGSLSVYMNNSFVSKSHINFVAPGEDFRCCLGLDPAVKIEYKSPSRVVEQVGFMSKSSLITQEQIIHLRNAKVNQTVQLTVKEYIPKSNDDKIKVAIVSPEVRGKGQEARLNKEHNLEWSVTLAPGQSKDLSVKYTMRLAEGVPTDEEEMAVYLKATTQALPQNFTTPPRNPEPFGVGRPRTCTRSISTYVSIVAAIFVYIVQTGTPTVSSAYCLTSEAYTPGIWKYMLYFRMSTLVISSALYLPITWKIFKITSTLKAGLTGETYTRKMIKTTRTIGCTILSEFFLVVIPDIFLNYNPFGLARYQVVWYNCHVAKGAVNVFLVTLQHEEMTKVLTKKWRRRSTLASTHLLTQMIDDAQVFCGRMNTMSTALSEYDTKVS
ncbi:unnamed protein product, partial [Mesorhabditis spiculigera]